MNTNTGRVRIAAIQQDARVSDPSANLADLLKSIDEAAIGGIDYIVATELSLTPYFCIEKSSPQYRKWAETLDGESVAAVAAKAREHHTTIVFPFYRRDDEARQFLNSVVVIGPDGKIVKGRLPGGGDHVSCFDKVHLPRIQTESLDTDETVHFASGTAFPIFETDKARIGVLICCDRRFPEAWRTLAVRGAEVVFLPGCIPAWEPASASSSAEMFVAELRTRALENTIFLVSCNRAGFEPLGEKRTLFFGDSCVIGPGGTVIARGLANAPCIVRATVDLSELEDMRKRLPLLTDRKPELYSH
jgi:N-carbamoylputrescine amidase